MDVPQEVLQSIARTSLGKFLSTVVLDADVVAGGIAIFDGSVRQIKASTPALCLRELISGFLLPWDCGPDALYAWQVTEINRFLIL